MQISFLSKQTFRAAALLLAFLPAAASAVPADPRPKKVLQADGTWITVVTRGDENGSVTMTEDGRTVRYNVLTGCFEPVSAPADGRIPAATARRKAIKRSMGSRRTAAGPQRILINDYPATGRQRSLVLLVEFSDVKFTSIDDPHDFYTRMLNEEGFTHSNGANGSVRDFYISSSGGLFQPEFVVVGPVTLPNTSDYYGGDFPGRDEHVAEALRDACVAIDSEVDFSQFDANGDGSVDNIYYFYAGYGQADNPGAVSTIWPHSANLEDAGIDLVCDGVKINNYACSNELVYDGSATPTPTGIGTFVHEFGHVLGLADHYDVFSSMTYTVGPWDTMSTGSYNNNGHTPPLFSAFEKAELGWLSYTELDAATDTVSLLGDLKDTNRAFRVSVPGNDNEYFVIENRQQTGWDAFLPGHGMVVWHIDMDEDAWRNNTVNIESNHQRVDIIAADGMRTDNTRSADPFPGTGEVTQATLTSWAGGSVLTFDAIAEHHGTVKTAVAGTGCRIPQPAEISITELADSSFTLTWAEVPEAAFYLLSISKVEAGGNERTTVDDFSGKRFDDVEEITVDGLTPQTGYEITLTAALCDYRSEPLVRQVQTSEIPFAKLKPANAAATDVTETSFTGTWEAVRDADSYSVTLYRHSGGELSDLGYGFDDKADGMPALWTSTSTTYYSVNGWYGEAAPSLRMSADGDCLEVAWPEASVSRLSFWCRSRNGDGSLHIEEWTGSGWNETASFTPPTEGTVVSFGINAAPKVRIRYERESGFVTIDDVTATCTVLERTPVAGYEDLPVGNVLSHTFTGLEPSTDYGFRVTALSESRRSLPSDECTLTTAETDAIEDITADGDCNGGKATTYDLSGRRLPEGHRPSGIVIVKQGGKVRKTMQ